MLYCEKCGGDTWVIDSRKSPHNMVRRRRECKDCLTRRTTYEIEQNKMSRMIDASNKLLILQDALNTYIEKHGLRKGDFIDVP